MAKKKDETAATEVSKVAPKRLPRKKKKQLMGKSGKTGG